MPNFSRSKNTTGAPKFKKIDHDPDHAHYEVV